MSATAEEGEPVPTGTPDETVIAEKAIGSSGGTVTSTDGTVIVTIPAGALATDQLISIQRITNTNPLGANKGYRLLPHGLQFAQPVSITFGYDDKTVNGTLPEALGIAFQNDAGVWWALPVETDTLARKVTVSTTHFSDWSLFKTMELKVYHNPVPISGSTSLYVFCAEDLIENMPTTGRGIKIKAPAAEAYIVEWLLNGDGDLTPIGGAHAIYEAPDAVKPPAIVSVELSPGNGKRYFLKASIAVIKLHLQVRVDGGEWYSYPTIRPASYLTDSWYIQNVTRPGVMDLLQIRVNVPRNGGTAPISDMSSVMFTKPPLTLLSIYRETPTGPILESPGMIEVSANEPNYPYIIGRFEVLKAGESGNLTATHRVEGFFYAMKSSQ